MEELKKCVRKYKDVDDQLNALNKSVYELREQRKAVEQEWIRIFRDPQFNSIDKLKLEDGSSIRIQRPNAWSKAWSLSRKDVTQLVGDYFASTTNHTADGCVEYILATKERTLVSSEFAFSRVVKE